MAYDEHLEERIAAALTRKGIVFESKKMMGGLTFMVDGKMCVGIYKNQLMARIDPADEGTALAKPGAGPMEMTGRRMKGFIFVEPDGIDRAEDLDYFVDLALKWNPKARASRKKKR